MNAEESETRTLVGMLWGARGGGDLEEEAD